MSFMYNMWEEIITTWYNKDWHEEIKKIMSFEEVVKIYGEEIIDVLNNHIPIIIDKNYLDYKNN